MPLTGGLLQEKARQIANELNISDFSASNGWLYKFQIRHQ